MNVHQPDPVELTPELRKRRELIKSAVEAASDGVTETIKDLRAQLDELDGLILQSADQVTEALYTHVGVCEAAQTGVHGLIAIVTTMLKSQSETISEPKAKPHVAGSSLL